MQTIQSETRCQNHNLPSVPRSPLDRRHLGPIVNQIDAAGNVLATRGACFTKFFGGAKFVRRCQCLFRVKIRRYRPRPCESVPLSAADVIRRMGGYDASASKAS